MYHVMGWVLTYGWVLEIPISLQLLVPEWLLAYEILTNFELFNLSKCQSRTMFCRFYNCHFREIIESTIKRRGKKDHVLLFHKKIVTKERFCKRKMLEVVNTRRYMFGKYFTVLFLMPALFLQQEAGQGSCCYDNRRSVTATNAAAGFDSDVKICPLMKRARCMQYVTLYLSQFFPLSEK